MSSRLLAADAGAVPLEVSIPAGTEVLEGDPTARYCAITDLGNGAEAGVWEMTAGCVRDVESDEIFVVLSGDATLRFDDGETIDLRPGVLVRLCAGDRTEWRVRDTLRKLYVSL
ncbi:MAG: cupin domain-containing protein [Actinomycetota bacterium]|nr:cupin domain-containing protein [Actinomycetota bacterium]